MNRKEWMDIWDKSQGSKYNLHVRGYPHGMVFITSSRDEGFEAYIYPNPQEEDLDTFINKAPTEEETND